MKILIVEDEKHCRLYLRDLIEQISPHAELLPDASNCKEAKTAIATHEPDLVFLDIDLPDGYGFTILEEEQLPPFEVIFTTAHSEFAVDAFRFSALHYLLKPVEAEALKSSIKRYKGRKSEQLQAKAAVLKESLQGAGARLFVEFHGGFKVLDLDHILRMEAAEGLCLIYLEDGQQLLSEQSLSHFEELLRHKGFFRTHAKHLVNTQKVIKYRKGRVGWAVLSDHSEIQVSSRRKNSFIQWMKNSTI